MTIIERYVPAAARYRTAAGETISLAEAIALDRAGEFARSRPVLLGFASSGARLHDRRDAHEYLGDANRVGYGVKADFDQAMFHYQQAVALGSAGACYKISNIFNALQKQEPAALWARCAAQMGHKAAQADCAERYLTGRGVRTDRVEALKWQFIHDGRSLPEDAILERPTKGMRGIDILKAGVDVIKARALARDWQPKSPESLDPEFFRSPALRDSLRKALRDRR